MKEKASKPKSKSVTKSASVRVHQEAKERAGLLLLNANKKKLGRKIKFEDLFELALGLVTDDHLKQLQECSLTHEDRKEILRQKYISRPNLQGRVHRIMMTAEFQKFLLEQDSPVPCLGSANRKL